MQCNVGGTWWEHVQCSVSEKSIAVWQWWEQTTVDKPSFLQDRTGLPRAILTVELHLKTGHNETEEKFSHENICQCVSSKDRDWMSWATSSISFLPPRTNTLIGEWGECIKLKDYNALSSCCAMTILPVFKFFFCFTYSFLPGREYIK